MKVIWKEQARIIYYNVLDYLEKNWHRDEVNQFINRTEVVINAMKKHPGIFAYANKPRTIQRAVIDKNNSFFYQADKRNKEIYLLTFFDNRQTPANLKTDL